MHHIDLFMYPVMYGSGNWGVMELLVRGRPVVAADRCYVAEMIEHNVNGLLVSDDKPQVWAKVINELLADDEKRAALGLQAKKAAAPFLLPEVAKDYMEQFTETIAAYSKT